jgi:hypothetical protein
MTEKLEQGGMVYFNPRGTSMLPMLHNDGDMVKLVKPKGQLKKYDLPLYRRTDGAFVLHRVVAVNADGTYTMCGDNQWCLEKGISHSQIVGKVVAFKRSGKEYSVEDRGYKAYCRVWIAVMPLRHIVFGGLNRVKRLVKGIVKR